MAINVTAEIEIKKNIKEVSDYVFEPVNDPKWIGGINKALLLTECPIGIGTQVKRTASFMGKTINYILEVTEFTPAKLMVMDSVESPFPMKVTYSFEEITSENTKAKIRVEGSSKGFYKIGDFIMGPQVKKNITKDLKRLKTILEK